MVTVRKMFVAISEYRSMIKKNKSSTVINGITVLRNTTFDNLFYPYKFFAAALVVMLISDYTAEKITDNFILNILVTLVIALFLSLVFCYLFSIYARIIIKKNNLPELF